MAAAAMRLIKLTNARFLIGRCCLRMIYACLDSGLFPSMYSGNWDLRPLRLDALCSTYPDLRQFKGMAWHFGARVFPVVVPLGFGSPTSCAHIGFEDAGQ